MSVNNFRIKKIQCCGTCQFKIIDEFGINNKDEISCEQQPITYGRGQIKTHVIVPFLGICECYNNGTQSNGKNFSEC